MSALDSTSYNGSVVFGEKSVCFREISMQVPLSSPDITQAERDAVLAVLETPRLSLGPKLPEFERIVADYCGRKYAAAVNSGTSGLHLSLRALRIGAGDEVVTTPFSFIASANAVIFDGGRPIFVDIDPDTWNIDVARIGEAISERTQAILPVDVFGLPADMDPIVELARQKNLYVVEDACEAIGATYKGRPAGSLGDVGMFAFYPNKQVTTGEGGIVVTDDERVHSLIVSMRNQGRGEDGSWLAHERLGFNYRISDINCALGIAQMQRIDELLANRSRSAGYYVERLADEPRVAMQKIPEDREISWFVMVVRLNDDYTREDRDRILAGLQDKGIGCSNYFTPIHLQPFYVKEFGHKPGDFPVCEALSDRTIALPFHGLLTEQQVDYVCATLKSLL
jgi:perosamine synthetase